MHKRRSLLDLNHSMAAAAPASPDADVPILYRLLTIPQVADVLQLSERQVRRLTATGQLAIVSLGKAVRVRPADLEAFILDRRQQMPGSDRR